MLAYYVQRSVLDSCLFKAKQNKIPYVFTIKAALEGYLFGWVWYHVRNTSSRFKLKADGRIRAVLAETYSYVWAPESQRQLRGWIWGSQALSYWAVLPGPQPCFWLRSLFDSRYGGLSLKTLQRERKRQEDGAFSVNMGYTAMLYPKWVSFFEKAFGELSTNNLMPSSKQKYIRKILQFLAFIAIIYGLDQFSQQ